MYASRAGDLAAELFSVLGRVMVQKSEVRVSRTTRSRVMV